jgi:hypothetical protein
MALSVTITNIETLLCKNTDCCYLRKFVYCRHIQLLLQCPFYFQFWQHCLIIAPTRLSPRHVIPDSKLHKQQPCIAGRVHQCRKIQSLYDVITLPQGSTRMWRDAELWHWQAKFATDSRTCCSKVTNTHRVITLRPTSPVTSCRLAYSRRSNGRKWPPPLVRPNNDRKWPPHSLVHLLVNTAYCICWSIQLSASVGQHSLVHLLVNTA